MEANTMKKTGGHILRGFLLSSAIAACQPVPLPENAAFTEGGRYLGEYDNKPVSIYDAELLFLNDNFDISKIEENGFIEMVEQTFTLLIPNGFGNILHTKLKDSDWAPINSKGAAAVDLNALFPVSLSASDVFVVRSALGGGYGAASTVSEWSDAYCIFLLITGRDKSIDVRGTICSDSPTSDSAKEIFLSKSLEFISGMRSQ